MRESTRATLVTLALAAVVGAVAVAATAALGLAPRGGRFAGNAALVQAKAFVTTFNAVALLALGRNYLAVYRDVPAPFTRSLLLFAGALSCYALTANPLVHFAFGVVGTGLGPFAVLPDAFAVVAVVALLHQSYQ